MVTATLKFIRDIPLYQTEKPYNLSSGTYNDGVITNVDNESRQIDVHDVRSHSPAFSYDTNGFALRALSYLPALDGSRDRTIQYLESIRDFLISEFQADRVVCYDFRVRQ